MKKIAFLLMLLTVLPVAASAMDCNYYADNAVFMELRRADCESKGLPCTYGGSRWQSNWDNHKSWCMSAPDQSRWSEKNARENQLDHCGCVYR